jgi:serine/threonine protein kinase
MPLPELIGRYRPVRRLGSGGFAVVWLAHDESLDAEVAVKVMADNWADRMDLRERFLREARMLRQASSYRIVQVFDIGELEDGRPYLVMEYADRGTLADRVKEHGAYPLAEALRITAEVARGVAELHAAGVVHRDLKPSNVLITSVRGGGERLLVADLGVAKSLAHGSGVTMSVGSAGYMAPEQMEPQIGVDVRADVYSLGAFAFYLMTAQRPYLPLVMAEKMPPGLPRPVLETLLSALERDRDRRWPDAGSLAERFDQLAEHLADDVTVAAPPPTQANPVPVSVEGSPTPVSPTPGWSFAGTPEQRAQAAYPGPASQSLQTGGPSFRPVAQAYEAQQPAQGYAQGYAQPQQTHQQAPQTYQQSQQTYQQAQQTYQQAQQQAQQPNHQGQPQNYQGGYPQPQQPPYRSAPPSSGSSGGPGRRGRGRWIATMVVVVLLAAATGIGGVLYWQSQSDKDVTAHDTTGDITLKVPSVFGPRLVGNGWNPTSIGLTSTSASGLLLTSSIDQWSDLSKPVHGVFVGVSDSKQLTAKVKAISHAGCDGGEAKTYANGAWTGTYRTFTNCSGPGQTVQEVALTPTAEGSGTYVYMQIRQSGTDTYPADELIDGLTVSG